jgi:Neocarzinostatin family
MITTRAFRIGLCIAMVGIGGLLGAVGGGALATAAGPKVVVTPSTSLKNGEVVHVAGSGFKPGDTVFIVECLRTSKSEAGCKVPSTSLPPSATITSTGALPRTAFKVSTGRIGTGVCGTTKANLNKCAVSVGNASGGDSAVGDITFALPAKK